MTTTVADAWASVDTESPPKNIREKEEEEDLVEDYDDEDYGDYDDDDNIGDINISSSSDNDIIEESSFGLSELSDDEEEVKEGCGHNFLNICKQAGLSILDFFQGVAIRIRSKISKEQAVAFVALTIAAIKAATTCSSSNPVDTPEEIAEAEELEEKNEALISDITNTVIESVVDEIVGEQ